MVYSKSDILALLQRWVAVPSASFANKSLIGARRPLHSHIAEGIGKETAEQLVAAVGRGAFARLLELNLADNAMGTAIAAELLTALQSGACPQLRTLVLHDNHIGPTAGALLADTAENLAVVTNWATRYPDVEFDLFFSPYSILYWDKIDRMGETDAVFAALELACKTLLPYENITLHGLLFDRDIIEQLDYYCDYVHHSAEAGELVLAKLSSGADRLTEENYRKTLANWRDFVVNYDYEKFWDEHYWYQFHTPNNS